MADLSFKVLGQTPHPKGAVHEHGVFQGDTQVGTVKVLALKEGGIGGFKVGGGLKTGHLGAVTTYLKQQHGDLNMGAAKSLAKAKKVSAADAQASRESASLVHMPGAVGGGSPTIAPTFQQDSSRSSQRAICSTPDCGGRLKFSERRNPHGFTNTWQHCETCGAESVVPRRAATSDEASEAEALMKKDSMNKATVAQQNEDLVGVNLDHDRIRVLRAIQALVTGLETPHTPDGKVNSARKKVLKKAFERGDLAKAVPAMQRMGDLHGQLKSMSDDLVTRPEFTLHHDRAAYFMTLSRHQLDSANRHMHLEKPSLVDRVHAKLGMRPAYEKHLDAADTYMRAAHNDIHDGDHALFRNGKLESVPATEKRPMSIMDRVTVRNAFRGVIGGTAGKFALVENMADNLKRLYSRQAKTSTVPAAAAPSTAPTSPAAPAKKTRSSKPRPADTA